MTQAGQWCDGCWILRPNSVKHKGLWTELQKSGVLWADSRGWTLDSRPPCIHTRQPLHFQSASEADCRQWTWDSRSQKAHQLQKVLVAVGRGRGSGIADVGQLSVGCWFLDPIHTWRSLSFRSALEADCTVHSTAAKRTLDNSSRRRSGAAWKVVARQVSVGCWFLDPIHTWKSVSFWRASEVDCPQQWSTPGITVPVASRKLSAGCWLLDPSLHMTVCQLLTCFGGRLSTAVKHTWYYSSSGLTKGGHWAGERQMLDPRPQFSYTRRPLSFKRGLENIGGLIRGLSSVWSGSLFVSGKRRR